MIYVKRPWAVYAFGFPVTEWVFRVVSNLDTISPGFLREWAALGEPHPPPVSRPLQFKSTSRSSRQGVALPSMGGSGKS